MADEVETAKDMAVPEDAADEGCFGEDAENEECRDHMTPLPTAIDGHAIAGHGHRKRRCSELMEPLTDVGDLSLEYDVAVPSPGGRRRKSRASRRTSELIELGSVEFSPEKTLNISYRPTDFQFYRPPKQRQRWGQTQVLPRVNWGDLFFDLFYVAAGYNVSLDRSHWIIWCATIDYVLTSDSPAFSRLQTSLSNHPTAWVVCTFWRRFFQ
jgi:hypothetical protein